MTFPKGRILLSDDDPDSRELIVLMLEREGYEVICPTDAVNALKLAEKERFDLFIFDTWMPGLSGLDLTRRVREFNETTPILFYSGAAYDSDKRQAFSLGAQGYLTKPAGILELTTEVKRLIQA
jgi:DNA-binding response OmpR family regulator